MILRNNEKTEIMLVEYNHILLKVGDNELDLSPRRLEKAAEEIKMRELNIEILTEEEAKEEEQGDENASKTKNKRKAEN